MRDTLEGMGWHLVLGGLLMVFLTPVLALVRGEDPDATWQAFALMYGFAFAMVSLGFFILKRIGAWPPQRPN